MKYRITTCPKCKGSGLIHDVTGGVFTFGIITAFELLDPEWFKSRCPKCDGKGFIYAKRSTKENHL